MKRLLYDKVKWVSNRISLGKYSRITGQKLILPFYHSVSSAPLPHVKHIGYYRKTNDFENDIACFLKHFNSVSLTNLADPQNNSFHLSFDDGLSDFYHTVMPLLVKKGIHATVFVNSDFLDNKKLFYRHKTSIIMGEVEGSELEKARIADYFSCEADEVSQKINDLTDHSKIEDIAKLLKISFEQYLYEQQPYLSIAQLKELSRMGFTIANHSKSHPNFKLISPEEQRDQISQVNSFLAAELGVSEHYFSFPFGDEDIHDSFFDWMYSSGAIRYSFGISGLKKDSYKNHFHRIPMEQHGLSAEQILKFEYFYFMMKALVNRNKIRR